MRRRGDTARTLAAVLAALVMAAVASVTTVRGAHAHTGLVSSTPQEQAVLDAAPGTVTLEFAAPVAADDDSVEVTGPDGSAVAADVLVSLDGRSVTLLLTPSRAAGPWSVDYRVRGVDGHVVSGRLEYAVRSTGSSAAWSGALPAPVAWLLMGSTAAGSCLLLLWWSRRVAEPAQ